MEKNNNDKKIQEDKIWYKTGKKNRNDALKCYQEGKSHFNNDKLGVQMNSQTTSNVKIYMMKPKIVEN